MKGANVVIQLVDALQRVRGNGRGNVSVGNVSVEAGGQAIVGTVQTGQRGRDDNGTADESTPTARASRKKA